MHRHMDQGGRYLEGLPLTVPELKVVMFTRIYILLTWIAGEFDMRVKSCEASDGRNRPISLSDENGCVLRKKMFSKFMKMRSTDARATVVTYAFFHAFKFPDTMAVQIRCKVEICRFGCPDHCQNPSNYVARYRLDSEEDRTIFPVFRASSRKRFLNM